jgi:hypothetical protein
MRLFKDSSTGGYAVQVNRDASKTHFLNDVYPEVAAKAIKDSEEGNNEAEEKSTYNHFKDRLSQFNFVWNNSGRDADGSEWKIQDMYSVPDAPILMPKVISNVVREAIEPMMIGTALLQRIQYSMGQTILLPSYGAISLAGLDIPEGGEYPEAKMTQAGNAMVANIGKCGIAVKISEEMVRYSQVDVINLHLRAAARCLARHKEVKIFNMIGACGTVYYDNADPVRSQLGVTTGRGFNGAANGSVTADDLFEMWGHILARGFMADTMLVHPLTYTMWLKDPNMRAQFFNGNATTLYASYRGSAMGGNPWEQPAGGLSQGSIENIQGDTEAELRNQLIDSKPELPSYSSTMGFPMTVIVSPFVKYDPVRKLTDVMLFDRNELGVMLVDEDPTTEEWNDPARDIRKIKIRERYALGILNEGQGVAIIKNAVNVDNHISSEPAQKQINIAALDAEGNATGSGGLEEIDERQALV